MKAAIKKYDYNGFDIQFDPKPEGVYANATAMAAAYPKKNLSTWMNSAQVQEYVNALKRKYPTIKNFIIKKTGRYGGTWIHEKLILKLAAFLNVDFEIWCDEKIAELLRTGSTSITPKQKQVARLQRMGKDAAFIQVRTDGIDVRNIFTHALKEAGVRQSGYSMCTRTIYAPLFGGDGSTEYIRNRFGLAPKTPIRDHMTPVQLAAVQLIELLAADELGKRVATGNHGAAQVCRACSTSVARSIVASRRELATPFNALNK